MRNWEICDAEGRAGTPTPMRTSTAHARDEVERRPLRVSAADADGGRERSGRHPTTASLPRRLFQCRTSSARLEQCSFISQDPSLLRVYCLKKFSSQRYRNAQKNRGPEDANTKQLLQRYLPTRRRPSAGVSSASLIANARDIVSHRARVMSRGVETEHQSPIDAKHSRVRSARAR